MPPPAAHSGPQAPEEGRVHRVGAAATAGWMGARAAAAAEAPRPSSWNEAAHAWYGQPSPRRDVTPSARRGGEPQAESPQLSRYAFYTCRLRAVQAVTWPCMPRPVPIGVLRRRASERVLSALMRLDASALQAFDGNGFLPLHYASSASAVRLLADAYPAALTSGVRLRDEREIVGQPRGRAGDPFWPLHRSIRYCAPQEVITALGERTPMDAFGNRPAPMRFMRKTSRRDMRKLAHEDARTVAMRQVFGGAAPVIDRSRRDRSCIYILPATSCPNFCTGAAGSLFIRVSLPLTPDEPQPRNAKAGKGKSEKRSIKRRARRRIRCIPRKKEWSLVSCEPPPPAWVGNFTYTQ